MFSNFSFLEFLLCFIFIKCGKRKLAYLVNLLFFGLITTAEQDLAVEGPVPLKFAGIGGVSEFLG